MSNAQRDSMIADSAKAFLTRIGGVGRARKLRDSGTAFDGKAWQEMAELGWFGLLLPEVERMIADIELFQELAGVNGLDKENIARTVITKGLMTGRTYYDVVIPLLGYHWLDFGVNEDEDDLLAMCDRAWHATLSILGTARGNQPALVRDAATQASPYKRD